MHILFAIPGLGYGGAERVVSNLANEFIKNNDVTIVLTSGKSEVAYDIDSKIRVKALSTYDSVLKTWLEFRSFCKSVKPDAVIAFMADTGIMSSLFLSGTSIPVIVSERNDPSRKRDGTSRIVKLLGRISPIFTKGYVFQSEGAKACYPKCVQKKSCIILNPLDVSKFPKREYDKIDNRIVTVGRLHPQKNHRMLIEAFAKSNSKVSHTLHIYGDGTLRAELEQLICFLGVQGKVFLEGNSSRVYDEIKNAKLFVFTSNYEGLPNALMEAMAIGLPCISTDCSPGGARMLINDGENGVLVPCEDVQTLIQRMDNVCDDLQKLFKYGEKAKLIKTKTNISTIADSWIGFINQCIK